MSKKDILVFVYGTLKTGGKLHDQMQRMGATYVGVGRIMSKDFVMRDLGHFPALQAVESGSGDYIIGEVYLTNEIGIAILDKVESCPHFYNRKMTTVWVEDSSLKAVVYYVDHTKSENHWIWQCDVIKSGEWDAAASCGMPEGVDYNDLFDNDEHPIGLDDAAYEESQAQFDESFFTVETGIFIVSDWGEAYGPYESIAQAVERIPDLAKDLGDDVRTLTIGFRMYRSDMSHDELADLESETYPF